MDIIYHKFYENDLRYYVVIKDHKLVWFCKTRINKSAHEEIIESSTLTKDTLINTNPQGMGLFIHCYEDCLVINKKIFNKDFETIRITKKTVTYDKHYTSDISLINTTFLQSTYFELLK